jgi:tRNA(fMet)-specific endonuclease VapC
MDPCLLDTNAVSDVIRPPSKRSPNVAKNLKQYLRAHRRFTFSEMSCYEVLRGLRKKRAAKQLQEFAEFCHRSELVPVDFDVLDRAASLWSEGQRIGITIGDCDLIIAATAILRSVPLVTANSRHFAWITGLSLLNWRE